MPSNTQQKSQDNIMTTLSCLKHVKRIADPEMGKVARPPAPPVINILEMVVDRSGSMASLGNVPREGLANFMKEQQTFAKETGAKTYFSLTTFDTDAETYYNAVDITTLPLPFSQEQMNKMVQPRGATRLVDTMMERLMALNHKIAALVQEQPRKVRALQPKIAAVAVFLTDGMDNRSTTWTAHDIDIIIAKMKSKGVEVLFLASNQDAITTGRQFGIQQQNAQTFGNTQRQARAAYASASAACYRSASGAVAAFTQREKQATAPAAMINPYDSDDSDDDSTAASGAQTPVWAAIGVRNTYQPLAGAAVNIFHPPQAFLSPPPRAHRAAPQAGGGGAQAGPRSPSMPWTVPSRVRRQRMNTVAAYNN